MDVPVRVEQRRRVGHVEVAHLVEERARAVLSPLVRGERAPREAKRRGLPAAAHIEDHATAAGDSLGGLRVHQGQAHVE